MKKLVLTLALLLLTVAYSNAQYGYRWILKPSGTQSNLKSAFRSGSSANNNAGFVCGSNGTFLVSTDGFNTWVSKSPGININLNSLTSADPDHNSVICCGDNGTVLYTTNAGTNWVQINSGTTAKLNSIVKYGTKLIAVGDGGVIITSTYSGGFYPPFSQLSSGTTQNLNAIYNENSNYLICGNNGIVLKSTNNGFNWFSVSVQTTHNLNSILGYSPNIIVCGNNGVIFRSTNNGLNWVSEISGVTNNLNYIKNIEFLFGSSGTVLYNQYINLWYEYNWKRIQVPTTSDLNCCVMKNNYEYYVFGSNGTILKREIDSNSMISKIDANNLSTYSVFRGVFDQKAIAGSNSPGFEWPKGSNKHVIFTSGLTASCMINGQLAQTSCSYRGEYLPGAISNGQHNDSSIFRFYKIVRAEGSSQLDWQNWGCMVPYGAPYVDVNNNGIYESMIDTPGVKNAAQTIFICLTDINPGSRSPGEGYGGGISNPAMGIELHMTKWAYTYPSYNDVMFTKFEILNKGNYIWNRTRFAIISDPDVGDANDDWVGCDTVRSMGYAYNGDNDDPVYGTNPPAVGYKILKGPVNKSVTPNVIYNMSSFTRWKNCNADPPNECDPNGLPHEAYILMQGYKSDSARWLDRTQPTAWGSYKKTKKVFYGDPETNEGWTAAKGYIVNFGNDSVGTLYPEIKRDYRFTLGMGADNYTVPSGDTAVIWMAQFVARGTSNLNSVTKLKQLADLVQLYYESNFTIGVKQLSSEVPISYSLSQNYPNPFNPTTKIKFDVFNVRQASLLVTLKIFDITGREVQTLVNEKLQPGTYEVTFNGSALSSGVYFYQLTSGNFKETKKLLLLK